MKHVIKHPLPLSLAKTATTKAFDSYAERFAKYSPTAEWKTDHHAVIGFSAKGVELGGSILLTEGEIELEMNVPFIFKPFRSKAMEVIEGEIRGWIGKAENGELADEEE